MPDSVSTGDEIIGRKRGSNGMGAGFRHFGERGRHVLEFLPVAILRQREQARDSIARESNRGDRFVTVDRMSIDESYRFDEGKK